MEYCWPSKQVPQQRRRGRSRERIGTQLSDGRRITTKPVQNAPATPVQPPVHRRRPGQRARPATTRASGRKTAAQQGSAPAPQGSVPETTAEGHARKRARAGRSAPMGAMSNKATSVEAQAADGRPPGLTNTEAIPKDRAPLPLDERAAGAGPKSCRGTPETAGVTDQRRKP